MRTPYARPAAWRRVGGAGEAWARAAYCTARRRARGGLDINANHLKGTTSGWVTGIARRCTSAAPGLGDDQLRNDASALTCVSRIDGSTGVKIMLKTSAATESEMRSYE
jgi:hypothetical protein